MEKHPAAHRKAPDWDAIQLCIAGLIEYQKRWANLETEKAVDLGMSF